MGPVFFWYHLNDRDGRWVANWGLSLDIVVQKKQMQRTTLILLEIFMNTSLVGNVE